jgi:ribosomal protein S18 acetylase RimI-like enzyme
MLEMKIVVRKMAVPDIDAVKRVDMLSWTDLMERAYGKTTRVPPRTEEGILSYMHFDPDGCFVAVDGFAGIVGLSFSHTWGTTGWVGPISVLPSYQGRGVGKELLRASLRYLEDQRCVDVGLETMPENPVNLGMYLRSGLRPEGLVVIMGKRLRPSELEEEPSGKVTVERFSESDIRGHLLDQVSRISNALRLGLDYREEVNLALEFSFGDTLVASVKGKVRGFCIVHTVSKREESDRADIRVLAVDPANSLEVLDSLIASAELLAADAGKNDIFIPVPVACRRAMDMALSRNYIIAHSFERLMWMGSSGVSERHNNLSSWSG